MNPVREPILKPVPIAELRPTQITIGLREVAARRKRWRGLKHKKRDFLSAHTIPVILSPKGHYYVVDHHHLVRALQAEGVEEVLIIVMADLKKLDQDAFWVALDNRDWMHPFDEKGERRPYDDIPKTIGAMVDDPFRSLAGALREIGGYSKETTPYSEFQWADFLRRRRTKKQVTGKYSHALKAAFKLAKSREADYLPGWSGRRRIEMRGTSPLP